MVAAEETADWMPSDEEFESWDEDKEASAIADALGKLRVQHVVKVVEDESFVVFRCLPSNHRYWLSITPSLKQFDGLSADGEESIAALKAALRAISPNDADRIEAEPVQLIFKLADEYGKVIAKTQGVPLGE